MKETFILYTSYKDAIMVLSDEQAGQLLKAIFEYATTGVKQELSDTAVKFAYMLIVSQIESSNKQYEKKCERNRENAAKRWQTVASDTMQPQQPNTNGCDGMQTDATACDGMQTDALDRYDRYDRYDRKNKEEDNKKDEPSICAEAQSSSSSDYSEVVEYWNAAVEKHGSAMRPLRGLTENRKAAIRARLREHKPNGMEAIRQMIDRATVSDFLNGRNSRNAIFTFDRLMSPSMFQKTLEGNYDNHAEQQPQAQQEPSSITRLMDEREQPQPDKDFEAYQRFMGMIEIVKRNPKHRCMAALKAAYENKTLQGLGIDWKPSDVEIN